MGKPTLVETNDVTIIDIGQINDATLTLGTCKEILKISDDLKKAFSQRRVVYLLNHGISEEEAKNMYSILDKFSALPDEIKRQYIYQGKKNIHGYVPFNSEQFYNKNKFEIRESFNILPGGDFPVEEIPEYFQCIKNISKKFRRIANFLLQLFAIGQNVNPDFLLKCHKYLWRNSILNSSTMRILNYPAVEEEPHPGIIRCGEHTDYGTFTLLMQDSEGGLEICGENGEWRRVGYIPGAIFLNTGDMLETWTSGQYKATLHRVVIPEENQIRTQSRHSIAFFVTPDNSTIVRPLHSVHGVEVKEYLAGDYLLNKVDRADVLYKK